MPEGAFYGQEGVFISVDAILALTCMKTAVKFKTAMLTASKRQLAKRQLPASPLFDQLTVSVTVETMSVPPISRTSYLILPLLGLLKYPHLQSLLFGKSLLPILRPSAW